MLILFCQIFQGLYSIQGAMFIPDSRVTDVVVSVQKIIYDIQPIGPTSIQLVEHAKSLCAGQSEKTRWSQRLKTLLSTNYRGKQRSCP